MEVVSNIMQFMQTPAFGGIVAGLLVISEALASIQSIKANSIFQAVTNCLRALRSGTKVTVVGEVPPSPGGPAE